MLIFDANDHLRFKVDYANSVTNFYGHASPQANESDAVWRIRKETLDSQGRTIDIQFAGKTNSFIHVWNDRASLF